MISLENLGNSELRKAIESNFYEILNNNSSQFEQYFQMIYNINTNMVMNIFQQVIY